MRIIRVVILVAIFVQCSMSHDSANSVEESMKATVYNVIDELVNQLLEQAFKRSFYNLSMLNTMLGKPGLYQQQLATSFSVSPPAHGTPVIMRDKLWSPRCCASADALAIVAARLLVLDTLVPGQRLRCESPPQHFHALVESNVEPLVVVGRKGLSLHARGVEVLAYKDGDDVLLEATGRLAEIVEGGVDEGSRWSGRAGAVRFLGRLEDDDYILSCDDNCSAVGSQYEQDQLIRFGETLGSLVDEWTGLVRATNRERWPGHLDGILEDLGPVPPTASNARAMYIAALINPLPALGVALEIRPAVITARTTFRRLSMVEQGLRDSIQRLKRPGPCF